MPLSHSMAHASRWIARGVRGAALAALLMTPAAASPAAETGVSHPAHLPAEASQESGPVNPLQPSRREAPESAQAPSAPATEPEALPPSGYPRLTHQGQIQFQLDDGSLGSPRASSAFPASNGIGPFPAASRLFVRRFRPSFNLALNPSLDLQTEFNIDPANEKIQILDTRFNFDLSENTYLSAGRFKVPFGWEGLRSSRSTNTIERSDMTAALYPERDVGLSFTHREPGLGQFSLGTFLGQPRSRGGSNGQYDIIGRALFRINDDLKMGLSGHLGTFRPADQTTDLPVRRIGAEAQYRSGGLRLEGEAIYSDGFNTTAADSTRAFGYYAAAVVELADPLDLVLHYDRFDPDLDSVDLSRPSNAANARDRKVIGLNYYLDRDLMHRVMLDYEIKQDLEGPGLHTNGFRLRYQLAW